MFITATEKQPNTEPKKNLKTCNSVFAVFTHSASRIAGQLSNAPSEGPHRLHLCVRESSVHVSCAGVTDLK